MRSYAGQALQLIRKFDVFKVAIKSEQLAMQDMAALRQEKTEFIQGLSQFLTAAQPLVQQYPECRADAAGAAEVGDDRLQGRDPPSRASSTKRLRRCSRTRPQPPGKDDGKDKAVQAKVQGELREGREVTEPGKLQEIATRNRKADLTRASVRRPPPASATQAAQFAFDTREAQRAESSGCSTSPSSPPATPGTRGRHGEEDVSL